MSQVEEDDILERLQKHLSGEAKEIAPGLFFKDVRPPIKCRAGGSLSVQASRHHYCHPREDAGPYTQVEIMVLGGITGVVMLLAEYHDGGPIASDDNPNMSVFGFVPIEKAAMLISMNGGIEDET
jgi:hypothetical protein